MIRCKFRCESIEPTVPCVPDNPNRDVTLRAHYEAIPTIPEDQQFQKYTPSGTLQAIIGNPAALAQLKVGSFYYIDLTPA